MKFIKSETLNKHWLNFLILLRDALVIWVKYYLISTTGAFILSAAKSKHQVLTVINVYEHLLGMLFLLAIITVPSLLIMFNLLSLTGAFSSFKKLISKLVSQRRRIILFGILPIFHAYSQGMKTFSHYSIEYFSTQSLRLGLALLFLNFLVVFVKERYLGYLFYASNSVQTLESDFTPYGKENIYSFDERGTKNLKSPFTQGEVNLKVISLLTPISRKFVKTADGRYHFVNSRYINALFILHKIALFFKGIKKAIQYQSPAAISSIMAHEGKVMTVKQRQIYALIVLVLVSLLFNALYGWVGGWLS
ncbi:hypothetical protein [Lactococcus allomyrinae]|uniref:Uncharacterized protein n=1 Tax=Lactococcus allomyrinae TaxID=2419773 RepID=A0A387BLX3_9LACT|nr:hypothetical protein [Lactococcus allomyrinae]AYG02026.1 hypothetical protein D7I46_12880 [Lactococcus allomyrinae]